MNKYLLGTTFAATILTAQAALALPQLVDSPDTYKAGHGLATVGLGYGIGTGTRNDGGTRSDLAKDTASTQISVPLSVRVGVMDNCEAMVTLPVAVNTFDPAAGDTKTSTGVGNLSLGLKYQFLHDSEKANKMLVAGSTDAVGTAPMDLSLLVASNAHTGKTAFDKPDAANLGTDITASDEWNVGAAVLGSKNFGAFKLTGNLGYWYAPETDGNAANAKVKVNYPDYMSYGLSGEYAFAEKWAAMLEVAGRSDVSKLQVAGADVNNTQAYAVALNPGVQWQATDNLNVNVAVQVPVAGRNAADYVRPALSARYTF